MSKKVKIGIGVFVLIIAIGALLPSEPEQEMAADAEPVVHQCPTGDTLAHEYCPVIFGEQILEGTGPDWSPLVDISEDVLVAGGFEDMSSSGGFHRLRFADESYVLTRWTRDGSDAFGGQGQFAGFSHVGR